jgi:hypothetical protein
MKKTEKERADDAELVAAVEAVTKAKDGTTRRQAAEELRRLAGRVASAADPNDWSRAEEHAEALRVAELFWKQADEARAVDDLFTFVTKVQALWDGVLDAYAMFAPTRPAPPTRPTGEDFEFLRSRSKWGSRRVAAYVAARVQVFDDEGRFAAPTTGKLDDEAEARLDSIADRMRKGSGA